MDNSATNYPPVSARAPAVRTLTVAEKFATWRWRHRAGFLATLILTPMFIYFVIFTWVPVFLVVILSFSSWNVVSWPPRFVGLLNYVELFTKSYYLNVIKVTIELGVLAVLGTVLIGGSVALALNQKLRGRAFFRTMWYLPAVISGAVMAQTLAVFLYPGASGVANHVLGIFGGKPILWPQSDFWMPFWVVVFSIWQGVGYVVIFFLAGLQSIDTTLYEAASVDGANRVDKFLNVTVPQMAPITLFVVMVSLIGSLQMWQAPLLLTQGGPDNTTNTLVFSLYTDAFGNLTIGIAAAQSVFLLLFLLVLSAFNYLVFRPKDS